MVSLLFILNRSFPLIATVFSIQILLTPTMAFAVENIPLYGLYERVIDYKSLSGESHSFQDPFYGSELQANFISPSGREIIWWGFYDGDGKGGQSGDIWRVRFMPDEVGKWTYHWEFADVPLKGSGSFLTVNTVDIPSKPGPLRHDPHINQWLITANGKKHVFLNMFQDGIPEGSHYLQFLNPQKYINKVKENGFDVIFTDGGIFSGNTKGDMDSNNPYPYLSIRDYTPRLQGWHHMEKGLWKEAYDESVFVYEFWGFYGGNNAHDIHKRPIAYQNKIIKYWLTRTAPYYIFLYNIGFELPEYVNVPEWPVQRAQFIKDVDPWDHLITGHEVHEWSYGNEPVMDFSSLQSDGTEERGFMTNAKTNIKNLLNYKWNLSYYGTLRGESFHDVALTVWNSPSKPHPHCNECIWNDKWQKAGTEDSHRKDLWDGIMGGMSYGFFGGDSYIGLSAFKHANNFFKSGVEWWTMTPHDELITKGTAFLLANPGLEYIAYSSSGKSFEVSLAPGNYKCTWFDPATGNYKNSFQMAHEGGKTTFGKPDMKDWVLHIKNSN